MLNYSAKTPYTQLPYTQSVKSFSSSISEYLQGQGGKLNEPRCQFWKTSHSLNQLVPNFKLIAVKLHAWILSFIYITFYTERKKWLLLHDKREKVYFGSVAITTFGRGLIAEKSLTIKLCDGSVTVFSGHQTENVKWSTHPKYHSLHNTINCSFNACPCKCGLIVLCLLKKVILCS